MPVGPFHALKCVIGSKLVLKAINFFTQGELNTVFVHISLGAATATSALLSMLPFSQESTSAGEI